MISAKNGLNEQSLYQLMKENGFCIIESLLSHARVTKLKYALLDAIEKESNLHRKGIDDPLQVICCPYYDDIFFRELEPEIYTLVNAILGEGCIFYNYSNSSISPGSVNFSGRIHVERRIEVRTPSMLGVMILLDDFTEDNGATWFLPSSHHSFEPPQPNYFYSNAQRLIAPKGSVFFFHPSLWHAGGRNDSLQTRHALAIGFCQPHLKQRLDMPALFKKSMKRYSFETQKKIGFFSSPPMTIRGFYEGDHGWM